MPKSNTYGLINLKQKIIKTIIFSVTGAIFGLSLAAIRPVEVQGAPSTYLNFQARLLSNSGAIVPDGNYHVEFKLYDQATLGSALWTETWTGGSLVSVKNGYLSVHLGSVNAFPGTINWSEEHWLTMNIGGSGGVASWDGEMNPRIKLTAVPFAFQSEQLAKTVGSNKGSLKFGSVTNDPSLVLPNESGTLCVQNSSNCGFLQGSGTAFLQGGNDFGGTTAGTIGTVNNGALNFITNNTTRMTLQSNGNLAVNTNTLFVDAANNRVGIGTATPSHTLDVTGNAQVSGYMQIGTNPLPVGTCQIIAATVPCTQGLRVTTQSTETNRDTSGIHSSTTITAPSANTGANRSLVSSLSLNGPSSYSSGMGADVSATALGGATVTNMSGLIVRLYSGASSTVTNAIGISTTIGGPLMTGTIQNATGISVNSVSSVGSVQNAIGMQIHSQTAGTDANIGLIVNESSTASLLLTSMTGSPNGGITFGFPGIDTVNLYRSGVGLLRTDNKLIVGSSAQINSGADANIGLVIQGAASQTANLQEWQDSTSAVLASVSASGVGSFSNLLQGGNQVCDSTNNCSYAPATGGTGYIQNQTAVSQAAGFNISGSGIIGGNLTVDTNTLFVDAINNRVGIGTATPSETLDVAGNARVLGSMALGNNTSTASDGTALAINHVTNAAADPLQCLFGCYAMALISRINTTNTVAGLGVGTYAQTGTVAGSFTLAQANGMRIDSTALGSGTTITDNYGMYIANQTAGVNDYGLYIQGADTYALWIDSGVTRLDGDVIVNGGNFTSRPAVDSPIGYRVQNANGATLLSVDSSQASNIAANSGAEVSGTFTTNWSSVGSSTITRTTTAANVAGGDAAVSVAAGTASGNGVRNNLASNPLTNTQYTISFSAKLGSGSAFTDLEVGYSYNGGTSFTSCNNYSTRTITTTDWVKVSCSLTTPANAVTNPDLIIRQPTSAGSARTFYVDNLTMMAFSDSTTTSTLRVGGPTSQGLTLLTLDSFAERPWSGSDNSLYGSMYYDTTLGKIQCYESDGWGACGGAPDNIVNLVPEYAGSVLNGTGVGTMTADLCSDTLNINDSGANAVCGTGQSYNFYKWTSPQATEQTYSVYISYQLPATFNGFADQDTIRLTGRTSSTSGNNGITFALYQANGVQCGATTAVNDSVDTWQTTTLSGDETACTFAPNDIITFRINMTAMNNSSAYVSNFSFTTLGK